MSLSEVIAFLLLGIGSGGLIAGVGTGVVLSYRGAGVINLAVGAIAMLCGYFFWSLTGGEFATLNKVVAVVLTLIFAVIIGVAFEFIVVRPQRTATPLAKLIATLGVLLSVQAIIIVAFGQASRPQLTIVPSRNLIISGAPVATYNFIIGGIMLVVTLVLAGVYRWTRFGLGTRAAAENEAYATFMGLAPNWLSLINTVLMSVLMAIVGLLAASVAQLDSSTLPLLVVPGLTAAMFGRFTSFGITWVAGILLGMGESLLLYFSTLSWFPNNGPGIPIPGVQELLIFLALVVAMYFRASKIPGRGDVLERRLPAAPMPKRPLRSALIYGVIGAVAMLLLPGGFRGALIVSLITAVMLLSIVIITGYLGQVSIIQLTLGGAAGFAVSHFATNYGIGFPWAPIMGVIVAIILGIICGIPALRVRGVSLAVVTLAAAVAIENFGFDNTSWGGGYTGSPVPAPTLFGFDFGPNSASLHGFFGAEPSPLFGWFVLIVLVVIGLLVSNLRRSALGQDMLAVRANERAASAAGINVPRTKLLGFAIAAGVAGVGGVLLAYQYGSITADSYDTITSLALIAFAYISGISTVPGAVNGGIIFIGGLSAFALQDWFGLQGEWFSIVGGLLLILTLVQRPEGVATAMFYGEKKGGRGLPFIRRGAPPAPAEPARSMEEAKVAS